MRKIFCVLLVSFLTGGNSAQAAYWTGNRLVADCTNVTNEMNAGACHGFIMGVWDSFETATNYEAGNRSIICLPENVTVVQMRKIVLNYMDKNPEKLHFQRSVPGFARLVRRLSLY
jgi:hypothetical protein